MFNHTTYEIVIRGRATARILHPLLDDFVCDHARDGETRLIGEVHDAAQLHGVMAHLTSLNAELISIAPLHPIPAMPQATDLTPSTVISNQHERTTP